MGYQVRCPGCEADHEVTTADAGSNIACASCGGSIAVPSVGELRRGAGRGAYESGPRETVFRLIGEGALPTSRVCALSGRPTDDVARVTLDLEKSVSSRDTMALGMILGLCLGPIWALLLMNEKPTEVRGRETRMRVPLRVARDQVARLRRLGSRRLLKLLRGTEPAYAELIDFYPGARASVDTYQSPETSR